MSFSENNFSNVQNTTITSFLQTIIPSSMSSTSLQAAILPYVGNLAIGQYSSKIIAVDDAIQNGVLVGIDCIHELTDSNGNSVAVKFRFFAPTEVESLKNILSSYGMTGKLSSALIGLQETVNINYRPKSTRYLYISNRALSTSSASPTAAASSNSSCTQSSTQSGRGASRIGGNHSLTPVKSSIVSKPNLLRDDENDDDDDFNLDFLDEV